MSEEDLRKIVQPQDLSFEKCMYVYIYEYIDILKNFFVIAYSYIYYICACILINVHERTHVHMYIYNHVNYICIACLL